jgi:hypothetical protein
MQIDIHQHPKKFVIAAVLILPIITVLACAVPRPGATDVSDQSGGTFPNQLTVNYQEHYLAMVIDSYVVNQQAEMAGERLKTFSEEDKIEALLMQTALYATREQSHEAQLATELAVYLALAEGWKAETIKKVLAKVSTEYGNQDEVAQEALDELAKQLNEVVRFQ